MNRGVVSLKFLAVLCALMLAACSPVRRLEPNEYLLQRNKIRGNSSEISDQELLLYVKQKPNRKILGIWRFHLQMFNLPNVERFTSRYEARVQRRRLLNQDRIADGKKPKKEFPFSLAKWFRSIGEGPVLADSLQTHRSAKQLEQYFANHGYFHAQVRDSLVFDTKKKRAVVYYLISSGLPYRYKSISYEIVDRTL